MSRAIALVMLIVLFAPEAAAQHQPDFERDILGAFDIVPTRAELDATPNVRDRLEGAALNADLTLYVRHRAITLMSFYPDARTRAFLEAQLLHASVEIRRRMAVYTLGRAFGLQADALLVARLASVIETDEPRVAEWAVRALRWVDHEDAVRILRHVAAGEDARLSALALEALRETVVLTR